MRVSSTLPLFSLSPLSSLASTLTPPSPHPRTCGKARLFDSDMMPNSGGLKTVIRSEWQDERAGDLLLQMKGTKVEHAYALVVWEHGYAAPKGVRVSLPGVEAPTRVACRLERVGRGAKDVALKLGAKDGGWAKTAGDVKFYELPPSLELRILSRRDWLEVSVSPLPLSLPLSP